MHSLFIALATFALGTPVEVDAIERASALSVVGQRIALVVGASEYTSASAWPTLPNAGTDAKALASELSGRYGFSVTALDSPTLGALKTALRDVASRAGPADDLFVFFAGHGDFDPEDNACDLVLKDATPACVSNCYPFDNLKRALFGTRARHALVMIDACHAGTFDIRAALDSEESRSTSAGPKTALDKVLKDYARYSSRLVLASVANGTTSDGPRGGHSPFMAGVLDELSNPGPNGVVSLDKLYVALSDDKDLSVVRPIPFGSVVPHHPNGSFLFIEDVPFCAALEQALEAGANRFDDVRVDVLRRDPWAMVSASRWTMPGTRRCEVWDWELHGKVELRCELGTYDTQMAGEKALDLFGDVRRCDLGGGIPSEEERTHLGEIHRDLRITLGARTVSATTVCGETCEVSLVIE